MGFFEWLFGKKSKPIVIKKNPPTNSTGVLVNSIKPTPKPALSESRIMPSTSDSYLDAVITGLVIDSIMNSEEEPKAESVTEKQEEPVAVIAEVSEDSDFLGSSQNYQLETESIYEGLDINSSSYDSCDSNCGGCD